MMNPAIRLLSGLMCLCGLVLYTPLVLAAASLSASPVRLTLPADQYAAALELKNLKAEAVDLDVRVYEWVQEDGNNQLRESESLIVTPPIFTLAGNSQQQLRVGRLTMSGPPVAERAYRVVIREIPRSDVTAGKQLQTVLQVSLPVFVPPQEPQFQPPSWGAVSLHRKALRVPVSNNGNVHYQISGYVITGCNGSVVANAATNLYVLAGRAMMLDVPMVQAEPSTKLCGVEVTIGGRRYHHNFTALTVE